MQRKKKCETISVLEKCLLCKLLLFLTDNTNISQMHSFFFWEVMFADSLIQNLYKTTYMYGISSKYN